MRKIESVESWVIYPSVTTGVAGGAHGVCGNAEWDAMELAKPGRQVLIQSGIGNEAAAERLARGMSGDPVPRR